MASTKYSDALIPKTEIGCKRKVLDTDYPKTLWRDHVELMTNDPVDRITKTGVVTESGREVKADVSVLAIGYTTQQMLCPTEIVGHDGLSLNTHVSCHHMTCTSYADLYPTVGYHHTRSCASLLRNCHTRFTQVSNSYIRSACETYTDFRYQHPAS
jgi:cation diffusion facilitator CzcD-associated flavoprotein CzcO